MNWLDKMLKPLARGTRELSPSCREVARRQSLTLYSPLPCRQRIGLRIHLVLCQWCRRYGKQLRFLHSVAHEHDRHEEVLPPQSLRPEARERIKQSLKSGKE